MTAALCILALGLESSGAQAQIATEQYGPVQSQAEDVGHDSSPPAIVIKGRHPLIGRTINSAAYDVKDSAQAQAGSAADVLNTIPSVHVAEDGAITVRGNGNVQLYIDGKPSSATASSATLQAMAGEAVARVEVITNPSANYDANGGAIVNLILKEGTDAGAHATLTANAGDHRRANAALEGSYGDRRLLARINASLRDDVRFTRIVNDRLLRSPDHVPTGRSTRWADYTPTHARTFRVDGSLIGKLTSSSDLGADLSLTHASPKNRVVERRVDFDPSGNIVSDYDRIRAGTYFSHGWDASISYQDRGSAARGSLKIVAEAQKDSVRSERPFILFPVRPTGPSIGQFFYNGTFTRQQRLSVDYGHPVHKGVRFSIGAELKRDGLRFENGATAIDPVAADRLRSPPISTIYHVTKAVAAAYVTAEARRGHWTIQGGERIQLTGLDFGGTSGVPPRSRHLSALNHNLSIARDIGSDQIVLRVSRTQQIFDLRDLDPLISYVDPDSRSVGNPELHPQEITSLEGAYNFGTGARSGAVTLYYRYAHDTLADYSIFLADNVEVSAKRNFGNAQSLGLEASLSDQMSKSLKLSVTANLFRTEFPQIWDGERGKRSVYSYTAQMSWDWKPNPADDFHIDANAQGPTLVPQGERSGTYAANMVWRHTISGRLTLSLSGQSVLRRRYVRTVLDTSTGHDVGKRLNGGRAVLAGIKYKFH
jgi:hypothetical protein